MAEQNDSSIDTPDVDSTGLAPRGRTRRFTIGRPAARNTAARATVTSSPTASRTSRPARKGAHPVRSLITVVAVAGLVATVAIPAFSVVRGTPAEAVTLQQVAADNAQSLVVASEAEPAALDRGGYTATTPEEIKKKKDEEAAAAALAARLAAQSAAAAAASSSRSSSSSSSSYSGAVPLVLPGSGVVRRPLAGYDNLGTPYAGHRGTDYMCARYTPIYAVADGVVVASSESGPGWGVYVKIAHNIGGTSVTTLYAHMSYGTRAVQVGETVSAGQLIGQVGDTGRAYGTHLHLEVVVSGTYVNGEAWLQANAG